MKLYIFCYNEYDKETGKTIHIESISKYQLAQITHRNMCIDLKMSCSEIIEIEAPEIKETINEKT